MKVTFIVNHDCIWQYLRMCFRFKSSILCCFCKHYRNY